MTIKNSAQFRQKIEKNWPTECIQRRVAYLKAEGVPIEELITVLAFAFKEHWRKASREHTPFRDDIRDWFIELGCTHNMARAFQEIIRPQVYQRTKKSDSDPVLVKVAKNLSAYHTTNNKQ